MTAQCCRYRISQSKTVEDKIMAELQSLNLAGAHDRRRPVAYVDLTKLPYLDAVIKVSLQTPNRKKMSMLPSHLLF